VKREKNRESVKREGVKREVVKNVVAGLKACELQKQRNCKGCGYKNENSAYPILIEQKSSRAEEQ